jgi:hypothetical protein
MSLTRASGLIGTILAVKSIIQWSRSHGAVLESAAPLQKAAFGDCQDLRLQLYLQLQQAQLN